VRLELTLLPLINAAFLPQLHVGPHSPSCYVTMGRPAPAQRSHATRMGVFDTLLQRDEAETSDEVVTTFDSSANARLIQSYRERVERINDMEDDIEELSDEQLAAKTAEFRERLGRGETEDDLLEEAFAVVREAAWRSLELRHYDVQLVGAMALHDGKLAQMATGEGKTLVATCAIYLNALSSRGAFVVTVNDYLARRDSETMGQVYRFLGLQVGLVQTGMKPAERRVAYGADVTYVTNSELGFDYLRDNLAMTTDELTMRAELNFCVVDEGDSVLVDEARVPLIISGKTDSSTAKYATAMKLVGALERNLHYEVFEKDQTIALTDKGVRDCERTLGISDLYSPKEPWAAYVTGAVKAKELFARDKSYLVRDGEAMIIDEFSGRVMEGRRWADGIHQAIEAKEGLTIQSETEVVASVTYQSLFRRFRKLASMSGTALTEAEEFAYIYNLQVIDIPSVLPSQRVDIPNSVYKTTRGKSNAALTELLSMHNQRRPVLVGTTSLQSSEAFSEKLDELEIVHEVLNASPESAEREAEIIAQAGRAGSITIATNMAGRGTDILLGGNPGFMARLFLRSAIATAVGISIAPPKDSFYPCEPSDATKEAVAAAVTAYAASATTATATDSPLTLLDEELAVASSSADVFEGSLADMLREALEPLRDEFKAALAAERELVLERGGLHVIGTNLHDSRRIDGQLRGRSGRQGDPGSTHFFLSLEDRIFRLFGGDKVKGVLDFLRVSEDQPLESEQVTRVVSETQEKVERYYYEIRQKLFEFDEVLAAQRELTYSRRASILRSTPSEMHAMMLQIAQQTATDILNVNWKAADADQSVSSEARAETILTKLRQFFPQMELGAADLLASREAAEAAVLASIDAALTAKEAALDSARSGLAFESQRYLALVQTDLLWKGHMKAMGYVKDFAGLKAYAALDPLQVYQKEGLTLYDAMQTSFRQNTAYSFFQYEVRKA